MRIDAEKLNKATRLIESIRCMQRFLELIGKSDGYLRVAQWTGEHTKGASVFITVRIVASLAEAITKDMTETEAELCDLVGGASDSTDSIS